MSRRLEDASHTMRQAACAQGIALPCGCREGWQERGSVPQGKPWVAQRGLKDRTEPSQQVPPWQGLQLSWDKAEEMASVVLGQAKLAGSVP